MLLFIILYSCTNESGARMELFTGIAPVLAILHDDLFTTKLILEI